MVELVDSVDLGSSAKACRFESCCPHQVKGTPLGCLLFDLEDGPEPGQCGTMRSHRILLPMYKL